MPEVSNRLTSGIDRHSKGISAERGARRADRPDSTPPWMRGPALAAPGGGPGSAGSADLACVSGCRLLVDLDDDLLLRAGWGHLAPVPPRLDVHLERHA